MRRTNPLGELEAEDGVRSRFEYLYSAERPEYSVEQACIGQVQNSDVIDDDPVPEPRRSPPSLRQSTGSPRARHR